MQLEDDSPASPPTYTVTDATTIDELIKRKNELEVKYDKLYFSKEHLRSRYQYVFNLNEKLKDENTHLKDKLAIQKKFDNKVISELGIALTSLLENDDGKKQGNAYEKEITISPSLSSSSSSSAAAAATTTVTSKVGRIYNAIVIDGQQEEEEEEEHKHTHTLTNIYIHYHIHISSH